MKRYIDLMKSKIMKEAYEIALDSYEPCWFIENEDISEEDVEEFKKDLDYLKSNLNVKELDCIIEFQTDNITFHGDFFVMITTKIDDRINDNLQIYEELSKMQLSTNGIYSDVSVVLEKYNLEQLIHYYLDRVMNGHEITLRSYIEEQIIADEINKRR